MKLLNRVGMRNAVECGLLALTFLYLTISFAVFEWRHPWATSSEKMVYSWSAVQFKKVPYDAMRPREVK